MYDGLTDEDPHLGVVTANRTNSFNSSSRYMTIIFSSDWSVTQIGFRAEWAFIDSPSCRYNCGNNLSVCSCNSDCQDNRNCCYDYNDYCSTSVPETTPSSDGAPCGGNLTQSKGEFFSPNFPLNYPNNAVCTWRLQGPEQKVVSLTFTFVDIESCSGCGCDAVRVYDGPSTSSLLLGTVCGYGRKTFSSSRNTLTVFFFSDSSVNRRGFIAHWNFTDSPSCRYNCGNNLSVCSCNSDCQDNRNCCYDYNDYCSTTVPETTPPQSDGGACGGILTQSKGEFFSPNFPLNYPNNAECTWRLQGPEQKVVSLTFTFVDLESNVDLVHVYDGLTDEDPHLGVVTANQTNSFNSSSRHMTVIFSSDWSVTQQGFRAEWAFIDGALCGGNLTQSKGEFFSPNFPRNYPNNAECTWRLQGPEQKVVSLTFTFVDLELNWDSVDVYDGLTDEDPHLGAVTQTNSFNSSSRYMTVIFSSDEGWTQQGFRAEWAFIDSPSCRYNCGNNLSVCSCTSDCQDNRNCCYDYNDYCSTSVPETTPPSSDGGPCGGNLTQSKGEFFSPNFPYNYPNNARCTWRLQGPEQKVVSLTFTFVDLESNWDSVHMYDGLTAEDPHLGVVTANQTNSFNSSSRYMTVIFSSDWSWTQKGFRAEWAFIDSPSCRYNCGNNLSVCSCNSDCQDNRNCCYDYNDYCSTSVPETATPSSGGDPCGGDLTQSQGEFFSPNFPNNYPEGTNCKWRLVSPEQQVVSLTFMSVDIESCSGCGCDAVRVYDGPSTSSLLLGTVCGYGRKTFSSSRNTLTVFFFSDSSVNRRGFIAHWNFTDSPSCRYNCGNNLSVCSCNSDCQDNRNCCYDYNDYCSTSVPETATPSSGGDPCGGDLTQSQGEFFSPNFPNNYPEGTNCKWRLVSPEQQVVSLTFMSVDIESCSGCGCDAVRVYDGPSTSSLLLGTVCGYGRKTFSSSRNTLTVFFFSDSSVNRRGFIAHWNFTDSPSCRYNCGNNLSVCSCNSDCQDNRNCCYDYNDYCSTTVPETTTPSSDGAPCGGNLTQSKGEFFSPSFPLNYPNNAVCTWRLQGPEQKVVSLTFTFVDIESCSGCGCDAVRVYDGPSTSSLLLGTVCGYGRKTFSSSRNTLTVFFFSDSSFNRRGFIAHWNFTDSPSCRYNCGNNLSVCSCNSDCQDNRNCCYDYNDYCSTTVPETTTPSSDGAPCGGNLTQSKGEFFSPSFPLNYPNNAVCTWRLQGPEQKVVSLTFTFVDIESCSGCGCDAVRVYDGPSTSSLLLGTVCGYGRKTFSSSRNTLTVFFSSDTSVNRRGFIAHWNFTDSPSCRYNCGNNLSVCSCNSDCQDNRNCCYDYNDYCSTTVPETTPPSSDGGPCGGILTQSKGEFFSPNFPLNYPNNAECTWRLQGPEQKVVSLTFTFVDLESNWDSVHMYDGLTDEDPHLGVVTANQTNSFNSSSRYMTVIFSSDWSVTQKGFRAEWAFIDSPSCRYNCGNNLSVCSCNSDCQDNRNCCYDYNDYCSTTVPETTPPSDGAPCGGNLTQSKGEFFSPSFPLNYPKNAECTWRLQGPEQKVVSLTFTFVDIESCSGCGCDAVRVYDGPSTSSLLLGTVCGYGRKTFSSSRNTLTVFFFSDSSVNRRGFIAHWNFTDSPSCRYNCGNNLSVCSCNSDCQDNRNCCYDYNDYCSTTVPETTPPSDGGACGGILTQSKGEFFSPNFPLNYPNNAECTWRLQGPDQKVVSLTFTFVDLESNVDLVHVYDGLTDEDTHLGVVTANQTNSFNSSSRYMTVIFWSDWSVTQQGFRAEWAFIDSPSCRYNCGNNLSVCSCTSDCQDNRNCCYDYDDYCFTSVPETTPPSSDGGPCGGNLTQSKGEFFSPNFPHNYPNSARCTWRLQGPEQKVVSLTFTFVDLESNWDSVHVYDGLTNEDPHLGVVTANQTNSFNSSSRYMTVIFSSDWSTTQKGFRAEWAFIDTEMIQTPQTEEEDCSDRADPEVPSDEVLCGEDLTQLKGEFFSPNYPNSYPDAECTWRLHGSEQQLIMLNFTFVELEWWMDLIHVYDGPSDESPLLDILTGNRRNSFNSSGRYMTVTFSSYDSMVYKGFRAEWNFLDSPSCRCNCGYNLSVCSCTSDCRVNRHCCYDYDDYCSSTTTTPVYCFTTTGPETTTPTESGTTEETTTTTTTTTEETAPEETTAEDCSDRADSEAPSDEVLCGEDLTQLKGEFFSPNYPNSYPDAECTWRLLGSEQQLVMLNFTFVDLEWWMDLIHVYDGPSDESPLLDILTGNRRNSFNSSGRYMTVTFSSYDSMVYKGFRAEWNFLDSPSCRCNCGYNLSVCSCTSDCRDNRHCCYDYDDYCSSTTTTPVYCFTTTGPETTTPTESGTTEETTTTTTTEETTPEKTTPVSGTTEETTTTKTTPDTKATKTTPRKETDTTKTTKKKDDDKKQNDKKDNNERGLQKVSSSTFPSILPMVPFLLLLPFVPFFPIFSLFSTLSILPSFFFPLFNPFPNLTPMLPMPINPPPPMIPWPTDRIKVTQKPDTEPTQPPQTTAGTTTEGSWETTADTALTQTPRTEAGTTTEGAWETTADTALTQTQQTDTALTQTPQTEAGTTTEGTWETTADTESRQTTQTEPGPTTKGTWETTAGGVLMLKLILNLIFLKQFSV
ncbi:cubilin-like [Pangasianodon hypophthalmus]|uniref:cubilin-like n=1 Tax=Pangasianodon hypophthalmus TaxID=310915 RepID=UPI002307D3AB|nr:cubilin-like [Pangasianodon hypophthalmus]